MNPDEIPPEGSGFAGVNPERRFAMTRPVEPGLGRPAVAAGAPSLVGPPSAFAEPSDNGYSDWLVAKALAVREVPGGKRRA